LPIGEIAVLGDLVSAENGHIDPAAADDPERICVVHDRRLWVQGHVLAAGIDEVQILAACPGQRAIADDAVLRMEDDLLVAEIEIRAQGRDADAEIDDPAILKLHRHPVAHLLAIEAFRAVAHRAFLSASSFAISAGRCGHQPSGGGGILTMRCTKMPGRCTSSGSIAPTGRMSSSTSTIVTLAAMAISGLKLRCERRKRRLPNASAW